MAIVDSVLSGFNVPSYWRGFRYLVSSVERPQFVGIGITQITMPTITTSMRVVPTLSHREIKIPDKIKYTPMILRAPVSRGVPVPFGLGSAYNPKIVGTLYEFLQETQSALDLEQSHRTFTLAIIEFESQSVTDLVPIATYVAEGCQASKFVPADADAQFEGSVLPLDTLELEVDRFNRIQ